MPDLFSLALGGGSIVSGIDAPLHLTQNDGTVMSADMAMALPVMSFASGATNSMRGAVTRA
jgi:N-methylhydantoinase A/oxoprolinase/acetone carboxylase beta subunit